MLNCRLRMSVCIQDDPTSDIAQARSFRHLGQDCLRGRADAEPRNAFQCSQTSEAHCATVQTARLASLVMAGKPAERTDQTQIMHEIDCGNVSFRNLVESVVAKSR